MRGMVHNSKTRLRPWLRPWAILTWHFVEDARNAARVLNSMYGLLVHMLISSHFFHGFVSSKKNTQWNLCVLKASGEKKTFFFLSCSIVCFLGQFAQCFKQLRPHVHSEQKRPNIFLQTMVVTWPDTTSWLLRSIHHVCNYKTSTVA